MNINGITIVEKLEDIDFSNIEIGNQFLIIKKIKENNKLVTEFNILIIDEIDSNVISFKIDSIYHCITDNECYTKINTNYHVQNKFKILLLNNQPIKISCSKHLIGKYNKNEDFGLIRSNLFKQLNLTSKFSYNFNLDKFNFTFFCMISDDVYFAYICDNKLNGYIWDSQYGYFIFYKNKDTYYDMYDIDIDKLIGLLEQLDCNKNSSEFNKFKEACKIINYDIKDYLNDNSILEEIKSFYSIIPGLENKIDKFFKPIYETDNFKGYLNSKHCLSDLHNKVKLYISNDEENLEINKRITKMIMRYLLKDDLYINPFNGDVINCNYEKIYEDPEHLIIQNSGKYFTYYFHKYDGIFIAANEKEKKEMTDLYETINKLTS